MCQSKEKGGLGIKKLNILNRASLAKWICRFSMEKSAAWRKCIEVNYDIEGGGWFCRHPRGSNEVGLWKSIATELEFFK